MNTNQMQDLYPARFHAVKKFTGQHLGKDSKLITYQDVEDFKSYVNFLLHEENLSPSQIRDKLCINYSNFTTFIIKCLRLEVKSCKEAVHNYYNQQGIYSDDKKKYWLECAFRFNPYLEVKVLGFELLKEHKFVQGWHNQTNYSLHRDHMISIDTGWKNKIDCKIICHPANCRIMFWKDNCKKNKTSSISESDLKNRIIAWNSN